MSTPPPSDRDVEVAQALAGPLAALARAKAREEDACGMMDRAHEANKRAIALANAASQARREAEEALWRALMEIKL